MLSSGCGRSHYSLLQRYDQSISIDSKGYLTCAYPIFAGRHRTKEKAEEAEEDDKFTRMHDSWR
jgi:hypothetical protein